MIGSFSAIEGATDWVTLILPVKNTGVPEFLETWSLN